MTVSFQLIELPDNEQVASRQVSVPDSGGTIGRSFECTIQLPDFGRTLSRVHAEVLPHPKGGYQIVDRSTNGVFVNDILLGKGEAQRLSDGDNVRMGAYTLLFSDMESLFALDMDDVSVSKPVKDERQSDQDSMSSPFNLDEVLNDKNDATLGIEHALSGQNATNESVIQKEKETFSADNVLGEDVYGYDPFEDEERWAMEQPQDSDEDLDDIVLIEDSELKNNETMSTPSNRSLAVTESAQVAALENSISRLNSIIEQQQRTLSTSVDRESLVACIESTLDKFLDDLNPEQLEDEFNDYISGWGKKDKKYWSLYKKQFNRKKERREFYRQFSALLFEELRDKR
ncbi:FHA domain-containing protein [Marinomonas balearica]|uniref:FHA domain protein n=1 Tax=Marinomonas balearica TaxID=491947 RepID=A0A4R6M955_9GAMM|nr:FHA domain-containing protein [Marinomonas balearica]TDO98038.1 FHA domain protein [Marinomonas balearica]